MIISQTPYRVSFAGGGTDLPAFYRQEPGAVLSVGLQSHMYVTVSPRFKSSIRVAYSRTEIAETVAEVEHTIVRQALELTGLDRHLEITTIGDLPAGTGMGSSSALTVGLLNALHAYRGRISSAADLAAQSCDIEINRLAKPIGKQDQYAAAFGGLNYIRFNPDESVQVEPVPCARETIDELERRSMLVYTAQQRSADGILEKQSKGTADKMSTLRAMRDLAEEMRKAIAGRGDLDAFGELLDEGWKLKRSLGFGISSDHIDAMYDTARRAGAQAGKLLGAGGGGFVYLIAPPERHAAILEALGQPQQVRFGIDRLGSRIIFISDHPGHCATLRSSKSPAGVAASA
ncbi:MAG: GHMP kinase [Phycisphaerales bacterium]|jgi:D-glycero-alpha-D-manno-heptose-7-phosphate kinase